MAAVVVGIIAVAWLAYLLPWLLKYRGLTVEASVDAVDGFAESMVVVRSADLPAVDSGTPGRPDLLVSTPLLREAARQDVAIQARTATRRRRIGLVANLVILVACAVAPFVTPAPLWVIGIGPVMLVVWALVAHASVGILHRRFDHVLEVLDHGWDEQTTVIAPPEDLVAAVPTELAVDLGAPPASRTATFDRAAPTGSIRPFQPRSVRTVDLTAPPPRRLRPVFPVGDVVPQDVLPLGGLPGGHPVDDEETSGHLRAVGE